MQLDLFVRDYNAFMTELADVLKADHTRFYLDTSLLMLLVRLGPTARDEFIDWCEKRPSGSVRVPVWAAHEFHRHTVRQTINKDIDSVLSNVESKLHDFEKLALERADDSVCLSAGYASRDRYVSEIGQLLPKIRNLMKIAKDNSKMSEGMEKVITFVNHNILNSDLTRVIERLGDSGEFRYSHHIPPGYHDKKEMNRYGDVVIWEEMICDVESAKSPLDCVLISCDDKTDWVSSAPFLRGNNSVEKPNRDQGYDVTLPHPLLVHEFKSRAQGEKVYVLHPRFLALVEAYATDRDGETSVLSRWRAAMYQEDPLQRLKKRGILVEVKDSNFQEQKLQNGDAKLRTCVEKDLPQRLVAPEISRLMGVTNTEELNSYIEASPVDRSSIMDDWTKRFRSGQVDPLKFGRMFADLIIKGCHEWTSRFPELIEILRNEVGRLTINQFVLGAIAPAYFDQYGELLTIPIKTLVVVALTLERDPYFEGAFVALRDYLIEADAELPYFPGSGRKNLEYKVETSQVPTKSFPMISDLRVGGESALAERLSLDSRRCFTCLFDRAPDVGCNGRELRCLVAREFAIPEDVLPTKYDNQKYTWSPNSGLVLMDTSSPGGLSAIDEEEEDDRE